MTLDLQCKIKKIFLFKYFIIIFPENVKIKNLFIFIHSFLYL